MISKVQRRSFPRIGLLGVLLFAAGWGLTSVRSQEPATGETGAGTAEPAAVEAGPDDRDFTVGGTVLAVVVPIHEEIEPGLLHMVRRGLREARKMGAKLVMLDIDTPGGRVDAAVAIKDELLEVARDGIDTAAFVNPEAISAGALLALSTKRIFITDSGLIGDAAPIIMGAGDETQTPEKVVSYVRGQFRSVAELNGYPVNVVLAMVDPNMPVEGLTEEGQLLVLTADSAVEYYIAERIVDDLDEAILAAGYTNYETYTIFETWSEAIARFLTSTTVTGLLMTIGLLAIVIEFYTPGIGIPAAVGVSCFVLLFWGHTVAGLAGYESLIIFGLGVILLGVEIFVIPGFGVIGVMGIILVFASLVLMVMDKVPWRGIEPIRAPDILYPMALVGGSFTVAMAGMFVISLFLPRRWTFDRLTLADAQVKEAGYAPLEEGVQALVGETGTAASDLRPAGVARIGGQRYDVVTRGDHIPRGSPVRVVEIEGRRIVVRRV